MKIKRNLKISSNKFPLLILVLAVLLMFCLKHYENDEEIRSDSIARSITTQMKGKLTYEKKEDRVLLDSGNNVYYQGNLIKTQENKIFYTTVYYFTVCNEDDENLVADMVHIVNETLWEKDNNINAVKIVLQKQTKLDAHNFSIDSFVSFSNYRKYTKENKEEAKLYSKLVAMNFWGIDKHDFVHSSKSYDKFIKFIYNKPETYTSVTGIKFLDVSSEIEETSKWKDKDYWYEVWPDLESYTVEGHDVSPTTSPSASPIPEWTDLESFSTKPGSSSVE